MRIIGGTARGRKLKTQAGRATRPTADRVREAIFNIVSSKVPNAAILDLFAGSGAMGIEALSRGASSAVFIESDRDAAATIKSNLDACVFAAPSKVIVGMLPKALGRFIINEENFDLIFIDPPYESGLAEKTLFAVAERNMICADGIAIIEHSVRETMPEDATTLIKAREKKYGSTLISFYERKF